MEMQNRNIFKKVYMKCMYLFSKHFLLREQDLEMVREHQMKNNIVIQRHQDLYDGNLPRKTLNEILDN
jgi:hypothetical protein